jgi:hypothetical protein
MSYNFDVNGLVIDVIEKIEVTADEFGIPLKASFQAFVDSDPLFGLSISSENEVEVEGDIGDGVVQLLGFLGSSSFDVTVNDISFVIPAFFSPETPSEPVNLEFNLSF